MEFRWNEWNLEHIGRHGVEPEEVESVVRAARRPWPEERDDDKWLVWGATLQGRLLQVIYLLEDDRERASVIHARPLTPREKRRHRRRA